jgi:hypothetical protein
MGSKMRPTPDEFETKVHLPAIKRGIQACWFLAFCFLLGGGFGLAGIPGAVFGLGVFCGFAAVGG